MEELYRIRDLLPADERKQIDDECRDFLPQEIPPEWLNEMEVQLDRDTKSVISGVLASETFGPKSPAEVKSLCYLVPGREIDELVVKENLKFQLCAKEYLAGDAGSQLDKLREWWRASMKVTFTRGLKTSCDQRQMQILH